MPMLIRIIAQRLIVFVFGMLAFFGVNPDLTVPPDSVIEERKLEQEQKVDEILTKPKDTQTENLEIIKDIEEKISQIEDVFSKTVTSPVVNTAKEVIPENLVFEIESNDFDIKNIVVNIVCLEKTKTFTRLSTGSGVIIHDTGVILTNAHVAYPFLKTSQFDSNIYSCSIRRENIPNYGYNAELVYFPSDWLIKNKDIITDPAPVGTGENDYALLHITSSIGPTPKKTVFQYVNTGVGFSDLKKDIPVTVAGYPSINTGVFEVDAKPGLKIEDTKIVDYFTFNTRSFDVLQTGVNAVARRGSSGGGIFKEGFLYGIVVTTNTNGEGSYINALTLPYIKKDFGIDTNMNFEEYVGYSFETQKDIFNSKFKNILKEIISSN